MHRVAGLHQVVGKLATNQTGWPEQPEVVEDPAASIRIPALDLSLTLEAIYRHVDL